MIRLSQVGSVGSFLLLLLKAATAATAARTQGDHADSASLAFRVRNVHGRREVFNERQRKLLILELTFSKEGDPIDVPRFQLQVFPTPDPLSTDSELTMGAALEDYINSYFDAKYPELDTDPKEGAPQFHSATVEISNMNLIDSDSTESNNNNNNNNNNVRRGLQQDAARPGTQFDIQTVLRFQDGIFPEYDVLETDMQDAMANNMDDFLSNYLSWYATPELVDIDSGSYVSGFTSPPTRSPTTPAPTSVATDPEDDNVEGDMRGTISQANEGVPVNAQKGDGINPLWPALGCGVAMFIITALILSYRRQRSMGWDSGTDDSDIEHISVDFDGRQEALELEVERQRQLKKEQEMFQQQQQLQQQAQQTKKSSKFGGWGKSRNHNKQPVESVTMNDGRTTIRIAPIVVGAEDDNEDEDDTTDNDSSRYLDRRQLAETPMIFNIASSMRSGESFQDDDDDNVHLQELYRTDTSDSGLSSSVTSSQYNANAVGGRNPSLRLPSMSRGRTAEFGRRDTRRGYT